MKKIGPTEKLIVYILSKKRWVPAKNLIELMKKIKRSEPAVRSSLFRLQQKGMISSFKKQKETSFGLTHEGKEWISSYKFRYAKSLKTWEGKWFLVTFNIPEKRRSLRNLLRERLKGLGFGRLHSNLWISPYNLKTECSKIIEELRLEEYVSMFITDYMGKDERDLVFRTWQLDMLSNIYKRFIDKYKKKIQDFEGKEFKDENEAAMEALLRILEFKQDVAEIAERDPMLPRELLPEDWIGIELEKVVFKYLSTLYEKANPLVEFGYLFADRKAQGGTE